MQRAQLRTPLFSPLGCAEVIFFGASGEEWRCAATWIGIVGGASPSLCATLVAPADGLPGRCYNNFAVRLPAGCAAEMGGLPLDVRRAAAGTAAVRIQCRAGTPRLEHGRFLLCGEIDAVQVEEGAHPWLRPLLHVARDARRHAPCTAPH